MAGTHADVREIVPEGLSISVKSMRTLVHSAVRRPAIGRYQVLIVTDADRLTEQAANALLKFIEEPPDQTIFLLCAPSDHPDDVAVTIRSRCRPVPLRAPATEAIADVLVRRDGIDPEQAAWAASVSGGHVGRARRLARDPEARGHRDIVLGLPTRLRGIGDAFAFAGDLVRSAREEATELSEARDAAEREELAVAMGAGGVGKGVAAAARGAKAAERELEKLQRSRNTRTQRDAIDRALVDLAGFYRDALVVGASAQVPLTHPDRERRDPPRRHRVGPGVGAAQAGSRSGLPHRDGSERQAGDRGRGDDDGPPTRLTRPRLLAQPRPRRERTLSPVLRMPVLGFARSLQRAVEAARSLPRSGLRAAAGCGRVRRGRRRARLPRRTGGLDAEQHRGRDRCAAIADPGLVAGAAPARRRISDPAT